MPIAGTKPWVVLLSVLTVLAAGFWCASPCRAGDFEIVPVWGDGMTPSARSAIQYAVDQWNGWLSSTTTGTERTVEITFNYDDLGTNTLGNAQPTWFGHTGGQTLMPAQYILQTGQDLLGSDGIINFNSSMSWHTDTSVKAAVGTFDMATVALHEIGHQMGFWKTYNSTTRTWGHLTGSGNKARYELSPWDEYLRDQNGVAPTPGASPFDVTGTVTFNGPQAVAVFGGPVPIYAPATYEAGSSLAHPDYISSVDNPAGLMSVSVSTGVARRGLADFEQAMFADVGWSFATPAVSHARGYGNGLWHDGSQWDSGLAPQASTAVYIDAATTYTVQVRKDSFASQVVVTNGGKLSIQKGRLSVTGLLQVDNLLDLDVSGYGAQLQTASLDVAVGRSGTLTQYRSTVDVTGDIRIGVGSGLSGAYTMMNGQLTASAMTIGGQGSGTFLQQAGTATVGLVQVGTIGAGSGSCLLSGGRLQATEVQLNKGSLDLSNGGQLTVTSLMELRDQTRFSATSGTTLTAVGATIRNWSSDPTKIAMDQLAVVFTAGATQGLFEVGGRDLGINPEGLRGNFGLKSLSVGGVAAASLLLTDSWDNLTGTGAEALYVETLSLAAGSTLDLGGLKLYYRNVNIDPSAQVINGSLRALAVPGDATCDGFVDFADYLALEANYGLSGTWTRGDFTSDGKIDFADYLVLESNFGRAMEVPEPATLAMLCAAVLVLRRRPAAK